MTFTNNPLTAHPLADQQEWWATDSSTKEAEALLNQESSEKFAEEQTVLVESKD